MKKLVGAVVIGAVAVAVGTVVHSASGQAQIIGVIERVVFEPNAEAPTRVQLWGAFTIGEYIPARGLTGWTGERKRGYLYFALPDDSTHIENARREWADLKSVAGTKQAVAFAYWDRFRGDKLMRIRDASAKPDAPDAYRTDIGVTKIPATGVFQGVVGELVKMVELR